MHNPLYGANTSIPANFTFGMCSMFIALIDYTIIISHYVTIHNGRECKFVTSKHVMIVQHSGIVDDVGILTKYMLIFKQKINTNSVMN